MFAAELVPEFFELHGGVRHPIRNEQVDHLAMCADGLSARLGLAHQRVEKTMKLRAVAAGSFHELREQRTRIEFDVLIARRQCRSIDAMPKQFSTQLITVLGRRNDDAGFVARDALADEIRGYPCSLGVTGKKSDKVTGGKNATTHASSA